MQTNYSMMLRRVLGEIETLIGENASFVDGGTREDRASVLDGIELIRDAIKADLTKKILLDENQAETDWQEGLQREILRQKMWFGKELLKELTNKRDKTVLRLDEDELEMELSKLGYFWNAENKDWTKGE